MSADPDEDDPFTCPVCGGSVRCSGDGRKDCTACSWDYRPTRDGTATTEQVGLGDY